MKRNLHLFGFALGFLSHIFVHGLKLIKNGYDQFTTSYYVLFLSENRGAQPQIWVRVSAGQKGYRSFWMMPMPVLKIDQLTYIYIYSICFYFFFLCILAYPLRTRWIWQLIRSVCDAVRCFFCEGKAKWKSRPLLHEDPDGFMWAKSRRHRGTRITLGTPNASLQATSRNHTLLTLWTVTLGNTENITLSNTETIILLI